MATRKVIQHSVGTTQNGSVPPSPCVSSPLGPEGAEGAEGGAQTKRGLPVAHKLRKNFACTKGNMKQGVLRTPGTDTQTHRCTNPLSTAYHLRTLHINAPHMMWWCHINLGPNKSQSPRKVGPRHGGAWTRGGLDKAGLGLGSMDDSVGSHECGDAQAFWGAQPPIWWLRGVSGCRATDLVAPRCPIPIDL